MASNAPSTADLQRIAPIATEIALDHANAMVQAQSDGDESQVAISATLANDNDTIAFVQFNVEEEWPTLVVASVSGAFAPRTLFDEDHCQCLAMRPDGRQLAYVPAIEMDYPMVYLHDVAAADEDQEDEIVMSFEEVPMSDLQWYNNRYLIAELESGECHVYDVQTHEFVDPAKIGLKIGG